MLTCVDSLSFRALRLVSLVGLPALGMVSGCGGSSPSPPVRLIHRVGPISIFEAEAQLRGTAAQTAQNMAVLHKLGVGVIRMYMPWNQLAPRPHVAHAAGFDATNPASYPGASWAIYDTVIRDATKLGMGVDLTIGEPVPLWATGAGAPPGAPHYQWRPSAGEFGEFMRAVGKRYSGSYKPAGASKPLPRVRFWAVWNGPTMGCTSRRRRSTTRPLKSRRCFTAGLWTPPGARLRRPTTAETRS